MHTFTPPVACRRPPPTLGEHTREVLGEVLQLDEQTCDRLSTDRVI
jgi:crotonobetainyl-CoA:carnitine CoA-transferase CaiB-like acyl-CoA transferase